MILPGTGRGTGAAGGGGVPRMLRPEVAPARRLRREMSLPEVLLWQRLRGGNGVLKFRGQHPVGPYVADFYCRAARLVIEVDGQVHDGAAPVNRDAERDSFLAENGYRVVRVPAVQILRDPDTAADSIVALAARALHQPAAGPPPRSGEDQE